MRNHNGLILVILCYLVRIDFTEKNQHKEIFFFFFVNILLSDILPLPSGLFLLFVCLLLVFAPHLTMLRVYFWFSIQDGGPYVVLWIKPGWSYARHMHCTISEVPQRFLSFFYTLLFLSPLTIYFSNFLSLIIRTLGLRNLDFLIFKYAEYIQPKHLWIDYIFYLRDIRGE